MVYFYNNNLKMLYHVFGAESRDSSISYYLYHPYSQSVLLIDEEEAIILKMYELLDSDLKEVKEQLNGTFTPNQITKVLDNSLSYISKLEPSKIEDINNPEELIIIVSDTCNMRCYYCYTYQGKIYRNDKESIPNSNKIKLSIDNILSRYNTIKGVTFFGGEPLLNFELIKDIINYLSENYPQIKDFKIIVNGTLITEEVASYLDKWNLSVTISIDGPQLYNDGCRKMAFGGGSYNMILKGIQNIKKIMGEKYFIESTYTPLMATLGISPLKIAKFIESLQPRSYIIKPAGAFSSLDLYKPNPCIFSNIHYPKYASYFREYAKYQLSKIESNITPYDWGIQVPLSSIIYKISKKYACSLYKFRTIYPDGSIGLCSSFGRNAFEISSEEDSMKIIKHVAKKTSVGYFPSKIWFYNLQDLCPAMLGIESIQEIGNDKLFLSSSEIIWEDFLREYIRTFVEE